MHAIWNNATFVSATRLQAKRTPPNTPMEGIASCSERIDEQRVDSSNAWHPHADGRESTMEIRFGE